MLENDSNLLEPRASFGEVLRVLGLRAFELSIDALEFAANLSETFFDSLRLGGSHRRHRVLGRCAWKTGNLLRTGTDGQGYGERDAWQPS